MSCAFSSGPFFQRSQLVCSKRSLALLAADCLALFGTMFLIGVIRVLLGGEISLSQHVPLALFLLVVPAVNAFEGLYSGGSSGIAGRNASASGYRRPSPTSVLLFFFFSAVAISPRVPFMSGLGF